MVYVLLQPKRKEIWKRTEVDTLACSSQFGLHKLKSRYCGVQRACRQKWLQSFKQQQKNERLLHIILGMSIEGMRSSLDGLKQVELAAGIDHLPPSLPGH